MGALQVRALTKTFAGGRALNEVDMDLAAGEVHALLGENGSGKSTLIKILSGYHRPDPGAQVQIGGQPLAFGSALASYAVGARFVHQDLGLVEASSISDNLAFGPGFPTSFATIRSGRTRQRAVQALEGVDLDLDPDAMISSLSPAQKTGVAVARALMVDGDAVVRLLVLDEPTARLPEHEVEHLLTLVRSVARRGVGVLYVTHRLDEVFQIASQATILRDGHKVASVAVQGLERDVLLQHLLGAALERPHRLQAHPVTSAASVLTVTGLHSEALHDVSFTVHPGEIVGIAGITGSGREALCGTLFGARRRDAGEVSVGAVPIRGNRPDAAMQAGVAYVPAERKILGAFLDLSAGENIGIANLGAFWRWPLLRRQRETDAAQRWFVRFAIRPLGALHQPLSAFSGGNQQKVVFSKWFQRAPVLFLLDEPTQGVDVGAKAELHTALFEAAREGAGIVISSSDVDELTTVCDRVLVLRSGRVVAELSGAGVNPHAMSRAALGIDRSDAAAQPTGAVL